MLVCGGRNFRSPAEFYREMDRLHERFGFTHIMHGGASGVDTFASEWAATKPGIERYVCRPDWEKHGRAAGPMRNARMLEWKPDVVIAFPGGRGTADMVRKARAAGVDVIEVGVTP